MTRELERASGGHVTLVRTDEVHVTISADVASPPGSSLEVLVEGAKVAIKVRGCRREGTRFLIDGRWVNLSRAQREAISRLRDEPSP